MHILCMLDVEECRCSLAGSKANCQEEDNMKRGIVQRRKSKHRKGCGSEIWGHKSEETKKLEKRHEKGRAHKRTWRDKGGRIQPFKWCWSNVHGNLAVFGNPRCWSCFLEKFTSNNNPGPALKLSLPCFYYVPVFLSVQTSVAMLA